MRNGRAHPEACSLFLVFLSFQTSSLPLKLEARKVGKAKVSLSRAQDLSKEGTDGEDNWQLVTVEAALGATPPCTS